MTRLTLLLPLAALMGGCIIYDTHNRGRGEGGWWDTGDTGEYTDDTDGRPDDTDGRPTFQFALSPSRGEIGTTFIASLTAVGEAFDFGAVEDVEVYGSADVLAFNARAGELLLTLAIPAAATPGTADLLLVLPDDRVEFIGQALTLVAAGTDPGDTGPDDTDSGGGEDSGWCP